LLEKQYPLPQMIQVVEDTESREKLIQAQELIIQLQKKINEQSQLIAQAEATKMLLEDKQVQLEKMEAEKADLQKQLDAERSKTWWQKLRGK
jgi:predicted nuclease with TOPRIM domain